MRAGLVVALLAGALATSGCRAAPSPPRRTVTDEVGREVALPPGPLARVVSLAPSVTEILFALDLGPRVVGIDRYSDAPAELLASVPRVGSNYEPSIEAIVGLRPDLVLTATSANRRETADLLSGMHLAVFATDTRTLADLPRTTRGLGVLFGVEAKAAAVNARLEAELATVRQLVASRPRVRTLIAVWDRPLYVAGRNTFVDDLLAVSGGENVAADVDGFVVYPVEKILKAAPELIIVPLHGRDGAPLAGWARWPDIPAVRNHRVIGVDDALVSRPGPRVGEAARRLVTILHPEPTPADAPTGHVPATTRPANGVPSFDSRKPAP